MKEYRYIKKVEYDQDLEQRYGTDEAGYKRFLEDHPDEAIGTANKTKVIQTRKHGSTCKGFVVEIQS